MFYMLTLSSENAVEQLLNNCQYWSALLLVLPDCPDLPKEKAAYLKEPAAPLLLAKLSLGLASIWMLAICGSTAVLLLCIA